MPKTRRLVPTFGSPVRGIRRQGLPPVVPKTLNLTYDGNSLIAYNLLQPAVRPRLKAGYEAVVVERSFGVSAQTGAMMLWDISTQILKPEHKDKANNILFYWELTNDIANGATAQVAYDNMKTYCLQCKAYGFKVIVATMLPRGTNPAIEAKRIEVNTLTRTTFNTFADALCDFGLNSQLGLPGQATNAFYADQVHPTAAGFNILSIDAANAINSLLP
jgi:hypothetical protein